jgi:hypothetical protein
VVKSGTFFKDECSRRSELGKIGALCGVKWKKVGAQVIDLVDAEKRSS